MDLLSDPTLVSSETTKVKLSSHRGKNHKTEMVEKKLRGNAVCCFLNIFTCSHPQFGSLGSEGPVGSEGW